MPLYFSAEQRKSPAEQPSSPHASADLGKSRNKQQDCTNAEFQRQKDS